MRLPGRWLRTAAARMCTRRTLERLVDPIVLDLQAEYEGAARARRGWRAAWIRISGYAAFWKALGLHAVHSALRALSSSLAADESALGRTIACSVVACACFTLLLVAVPMSRFSSPGEPLTLAMLLLPQALALSIPTALAIGIVWSGRGARIHAARIRGVLTFAVAATLAASVAMWMLPAANQAFRVAMAQELGGRGITTSSIPRGPNELSLSELAAATREYDARGLAWNARRFRQAYHVRLALPAATFVLSLLALGICRTVGGRVQPFFASVIACGVFWWMQGLAGKATSLPPIVAVWAPSAALAIVALGLFRIPARS